MRTFQLIFRHLIQANRDKKAASACQCHFSGPIGKSGNPFLPDWEMRAGLYGVSDWPAERKKE